MRIIYILSATVMSGGATKAALNMISSALGENDRGLIICPDTQGVYQYLDDKQRWPNLDVKAIKYTYDLRIKRSGLFNTLLYLPRKLRKALINRGGVKELLKICRDFKPDIIHTNTAVNDIGHRAAKHLGIPHIYHLREYGDKDFNMIVPDQKKKFSTPGNYKISITKDILKYKGLENDPTARVIYDGVVSEIHPPIPSDSRYFLYAGRLTPNKGVFDLLHAYIEYAKKENAEPLPLKLAGLVEPEIESKISHLASLHGLSKKIEVLGVISDLSGLYRDAAAVIIPSLHEGFGFIIPEATSYGALTIGRNTGGTKEQYDNGLELTGEEIGLRFSTVAELTDLLLQVAHTDKKDCMDMINRAQSVVRQLYTVEASGKDVKNFYNEILNKNE